MGRVMAQLPRSSTSKIKLVPPRVSIYNERFLECKTLTAGNLGSAWIRGVISIPVVEL